ncbi:MULTISPECIES: trehalose-phosphatase [unclassified Rhodanobacter]|uniref:trehalose-phosphatase n=1 Tax=unclassified Rhodanobacter TaxID=2621553 RepID=UPI001BE0682D|nr:MULTISPECIES: trehalose-phosphatase [unclassified Rhodanobacter]MBT2145510.1 trehalose-phosphatase [Rhodanobacter sp. LX-99]MBT2149555.1 trehalose-phosphatase [Rhodanobacter sp. LX-100]
MSTATPAIARAPHDPLPPPPLPDAGTRWAIFLDVDGTLLDFADDPLAVRPDAALLRLLHALHRRLDGALALVSGRELADLDRLFAASHWAAAGLHGLQLRHADGSRRDFAVAPAQQARMRDAAHTLAARFDGVQLEDKRAAIALHCRRAPAQLPALHEAAIAVMTHLPGYELQPGNLVLEFKPAGVDKGRAVLELLQHAPFAGRRPVYLGDDLTDEHAFASINARDGLSVRIGMREPSLAAFTLPGPAAAEAWLTRVLDALTHGAPIHARLQGDPTRQP